MSHKASCHCGKVAFEVSGDVGSVIEGNAMAAINARCIEDIDLPTIPVTQFDGRSA
jgi:hypothetical protein